MQHESLVLKGQFPSPSKDVVSQNRWSHAKGPVVL